MKRLASVLLASVIAAAFLGPGTITTAARAGAGFGFELLWTLVFATVACLVLQEASARLTVVSGHNLGEALRLRFHGGVRGLLMLGLAAGAILLGCAAYEAGNILGGVAGARLALDVSPQILTLISAGAAALMLWLGSTRVVVTVLSTLVALMGVTFFWTALSLAPALKEILAGLAVPRVPEGSGILVLGLIGTTVVPYNLFLGSGLARGQKLGELRFGLVVAIVLGGVISMAVLIVGSALAGAFTYDALGQTLAAQLGPWAAWLFALGLFAAGFSSAVTAPLAAAITAKSLFAASSDDPRWNEASVRYRGVWSAVLLAGVVFGVLDVRPVPAIIAAQALNGLLLPVMAIFLLLEVNDRKLLGDALNGPLSNVLTVLVTAVTAVLGLRSFLRATASALGTTFPETVVLGIAVGVVLLLAVPVGWGMRRLRVSH